MRVFSENNIREPGESSPVSLTVTEASIDASRTNRLAWRFEPANGYYTVSQHWFARNPANLCHEFSFPFLAIKSFLHLQFTGRLHGDSEKEREEDLCLCLCLCPSVSVCLSVCLPACLSVCLSVCLSLSLFLSLSLRVCLSPGTCVIGGACFECVCWGAHLRACVYLPPLPVSLSCYHLFVWLSTEMH